MQFTMQQYIARRVGGKATRLLVLAILAVGLSGSPLSHAQRQRFRDIPVESTLSTLEYDGLQRTYRLYVGAGYHAAVAAPLVFILHGGGGSGEDAERLTLNSFNRLADQNGFLVVYPEGIENHWNDGRAGVRWKSHTENIDDVGYISALIDQLAAQYTLDLSRVYATGLSNGGMMSFRLACDLADRIAAVATLAALMTGAIPCEPSRPIAVMTMVGTEDPLVPLDGGGRRILGANIGAVWSLDEVTHFWTTHNQCSTDVVSSMLDEVDDGTTVQITQYSPCAADTEYVLYHIEGGGHTWSQGAEYLPERMIGRTSQEFNASQVIWDFFQRHTLPIN